MTRPKEWKITEWRLNEPIDRIWKKFEELKIFGKLGFFENGNVSSLSSSRRSHLHVEEWGIGLSVAEGLEEDRFFFFPPKAKAFIV